MVSVDVSYSEIYSIHLVTMMGVNRVIMYLPHVIDTVVTTHHSNAVVQSLTN